MQHGFLTEKSAPPNFDRAAEIQEERGSLFLREAFLFWASDYKESPVPQVLVYAVREHRLVSDNHIQRSPPPLFYKRRR